MYNGVRQALFTQACYINMTKTTSYGFYLGPNDDAIDRLHEFAQWTIVWLKQFRVAHCVACCHW